MLENDTVCALLPSINLSCIFPGNTERVNEIFCSCVKCKRNSRNNVGIEKKPHYFSPWLIFSIKKKIQNPSSYDNNKLRIALQNIIYLLYRSRKVESTVYFVRKTYRNFSQLDSKILKSTAHLQITVNQICQQSIC